MNAPIKWTAPPPAVPPQGATLPSAMLTGPVMRYRPSTKTDVGLTIDAERKRVGALTGAQVRAQRAARIKAEREADAINPTTVVAIDRKVAR